MLAMNVMQNNSYCFIHKLPVISVNNKWLIAEFQYSIWIDNANTTKMLHLECNSKPGQYYTKMFEVCKFY